MDSKIKISSFENIQRIGGSTTYKHYIHDESKKDTLALYVHGYFDSKNATVGENILGHCQDIGIDFLSYDGFGFGDSKLPLDTITLSQRVVQLQELVELIVLQKFEYNRILLIGHSMGGFISVVASRDIPCIYNNLCGLILLAPGMMFSSTGVDVFSDLPSEKLSMLTSGQTVDLDGVLLTEELLSDARNITPSSSSKIGGSFKIALLWGTDDKDTPIELAGNLIDYVQNQDRLTFNKIPGAGHLFLRESDRKEVRKAISLML